MYLGELRPKPRRRSSPVRVVILLVLIGFSLYLYGLVRREEIVEPYVPLPTPTRSALSYADEADDLYRQGQLRAAIERYRQARALDPSDVRLLIPLVRLLTVEGRLDEAIAGGEEAVRMAPENARAWAALGMAYDWRRQLTKAAEACSRAVELDPGEALGHACLAEVYADQMRWDEANEAAQRALSLDPNSVDAHRNHGYVLEVQGNWSGAIEEYRKALEIHPNLAYIHMAVGRNYRALGDFRAALEAFERAVEIDPDNALANDQLGWTYFNIGEYQQAELYLKQATESDPTLGQAFGHLAITYWTRRNYEAAIPNFEQALKLELAAARRRARAFVITVETPGEQLLLPSAEVVLRGEFVASPDGASTQAILAPPTPGGARGNTGGSVTLDVLSGRYTLAVQGMPMRTDGRVYVGWFEGLDTLSGDPVHSEPLRIRLDGSAQIEQETGWVKAAPIEYYYTLGLAYYYLDQCEKAYPLFDAALQIDPEDPNAPEGIRLCRIAQE
jgi:tetratricopeptide (TPR) repeat protein